ncbi:MAG: glycosyltransferase family 9 protein [Candidatus Paceibacterota bacterium]|jgi:ADP-heptose:LPS heptosyltransferase
MHKITVFYTRVLILFSFVLFPFILLLIWVRKSRNRRVNLEKMRILILPQLTRIGDVVCSTPVFRALKEAYPDGHLAVLSSLNACGILKNNPRIDEIIVIEDWQDNFLGLLRKIRDDRFDWGISLSGSALSSVLFFYGLIPNRLKITRSARPFAEIYSDWMCTLREEYGALSYLPIFYLKMLRHLGIHSSDDRKEVFCRLESGERVEAFFRSKRVAPEDTIVGVSLSAGNKIKEWGDDKFEALCREIRKDYGMKIVIIGSLYEKQRIDALLGKLGDPTAFISAVGFSIEELPDLMKRFSYFIAVDTGPVHIAHALDIPIIDILGPVNDIELTPRGNAAIIVKSPSDIPPTIFAFQEALDRELTKKSMDSITVAKVLDAFDCLVKQTQIPRTPRAVV